VNAGGASRTERARNIIQWQIHHSREFLPVAGNCKYQTICALFHRLVRFQLFITLKHRYNCRNTTNYCQSLLSGYKQLQIQHLRNSQWIFRIFQISEIQNQLENTVFLGICTIHGHSVKSVAKSWFQMEILSHIDAFGKRISQVGAKDGNFEIFEFKSFPTGKPIRHITTTPYVMHVSFKLDASDCQ